MAFFEISISIVLLFFAEIPLFLLLILGAIDSKIKTLLLQDIDFKIFNNRIMWSVKVSSTKNCKKNLSLGKDIG